MSAPVVGLLDADPDLGERLVPSERQRARELIRVRVFVVRRGPWVPPELPAASAGLIILEGLMVRRLRLGGVFSTELVGPSDIIRPWEEDLPSLVPGTPEWRVLQQARVALVDARATALAGQWPELVSAIAGRLLRRARSLAYLMAAQHHVRVRDRLLLTLWHLASMWGRVTPAGTVIPFRLTHEMLAHIIGAQRPTTTMAINALLVEGRLAVGPQRHFVLLGDPPGDELAVPAVET